MKRILSIAGWTLIVALLVSAFTVPSKEKCRAYVMKSVYDTIATKVTIYENPFKFLGARIFTINTVYFDKQITIDDLRKGRENRVQSAAEAALNATSFRGPETYIGLYGTFWKW